MTEPIDLDKSHSEREALFFNANARGDALSRAANVIIHLLPINLALLFRECTKKETDVEHCNRLTAVKEALIEAAAASIDNKGRAQCPLCRDGHRYKLPTGLERHLGGQFSARKCEVMCIVEPYTEERWRRHRL